MNLHQHEQPFIFKHPYLSDNLKNSSLSRIIIGSVENILSLRLPQRSGKCLFNDHVNFFVLIVSLITKLYLMRTLFEVNTIMTQSQLRNETFESSSSYDHSVVCANSFTVQNSGSEMSIFEWINYVPKEATWNRLSLENSRSIIQLFGVTCSV